MRNNPEVNLDELEKPNKESTIKIGPSKTGEQMNKKFLVISIISVFNLCALSTAGAVNTCGSAGTPQKDVTSGGGCASPYANNGVPLLTMDSCKGAYMQHPDPKGTGWIQCQWRTINGYEQCVTTNGSGQYVYCDQP